MRGWAVGVFLATALSILSVLPLSAATPASLVTTNRYLIVVETSRAMQSRLEATTQAVHDLLVTFLGAELSAGDSIGIWTFNEALYAGQFPLQKWDPGKAEEIAGGVVKFLAARPYEKTAALDKCLPSLKRVSERSSYLTVVLITAGDPIHGTAFDADINARFAQWRAEQQRAKMPLVTVLRAEDGKLTAFAVTPAPWAVELPPFPGALLAARRARSAPAPAPAPATNAPPPPIGKPLIVVGKKPAPAPAPATGTAAVAATSTNAAPAAIAAASSSPVVTPPAEVTPPPPAAKSVAAETRPAAAAPVPQPEALASAPAKSGLGVRWLIAGAVLIVLFVGVWIWRSRARPPGSGSLITQAGDRED